MVWSERSNRGIRSGSSGAYMLPYASATKCVEAVAQMAGCSRNRFTSGQAACTALGHACELAAEVAGERHQRVLFAAVQSRLAGFVEPHCRFDGASRHTSHDADLVECERRQSLRLPEYGQALGDA